MQEETIAIIFILFVIGAFILYRRWFKSREKIYTASDEVIGGYRLRIIEHNPRTNDAQVVIHIQHPMKELDIEEVFIEFISRGREFQLFSIADFFEEEIPVKYAEDQRSASIKFYKSEFLRHIRNRDIKLYRFRFVWIKHNGNKLKTHEMAISARYIFFKPDSGIFN